MSSNNCHYVKEIVTGKPLHSMWVWWYEPCVDVPSEPPSDAPSFWARGAALCAAHDAERARPTEYGVIELATAQELAYAYAKSIAVALQRKHFPEHTDWKPLPDLLGVLTQIDNAVSELVRSNSKHAQQELRAYNEAGERVFSFQMSHYDARIIELALFAMHRDAPSQSKMGGPAKLANDLRNRVLAWLAAMKP